MSDKEKARAEARAEAQELTPLQRWKMEKHFPKFALLSEAGGRQAFINFATDTEDETIPATEEEAIQRAKAQLEVVSQQLRANKLKLEEERKAALLARDFDHPSLQGMLMSESYSQQRIDQMLNKWDAELPKQFQLRKNKKKK